MSRDLAVKRPLPPLPETPSQGARALVAFSGRTDLKWLRLLKPGYRHCFAVVEAPGGRDGDAPRWLLYNPLSVGTQMALWPGVDAAELRAGLEAEGYTVVQTRVRPLGRRVLGWRPFTCVEAVKRVLGLRAPAVLTPWQLRRYLEEYEKGWDYVRG